MANFNEIKEKVMGTLGVVADATKDIANKTADKAKAAARMAKLAVEINGEKDTVKKAYLEIGKLYYELHRDDPDGFFAQLCDEVSIANASIAAKEAEIAELKASGVVADEDADIEIEFTDFEEPADDCGCTACGGTEAPKAPEEEPTEPACGDCCACKDEEEE